MKSSSFLFGCRGSERQGLALSIVGSSGHTWHALRWACSCPWRSRHKEAQEGHPLSITTTTQQVRTATRKRTGHNLFFSCLVLSCLVLSCLVLSCPVLSCPVLSCLVLSCLVLSCLVLSRLVSSCRVLSCLVLSSIVLSRLVLSGHNIFLSCLVLCCLVLPCLVLS